MVKTNAKKDADNNNSNNKKRNLALNPKKKNQKNPTHNTPATAAASSSDEDAIHLLLEPYTKEQLISFLTAAAASNSSLSARIRAAADADVSHRKVFVHGLGWDTTRDTLLSAFLPYGAVEDCNVVVDKLTGRSKGYGFVLFKSRSGAVNALKEPHKKIQNRLTHSQLASVGPALSAAGSGPHANAEGRRVYVSNVHADAAPDKLKAFFAKFGEIEAGPIGFDMNTGKSRGFALFVYKTREAASRALEEPYKMFEGHQLHCQKATDPSKKGNAAGATALAPAALMGQDPLLAAAALNPAVAAALNPSYAALLGQNSLLVAAALNPALAAALNPLAAPQGQHYEGVGLSSGSSSLLGAYGLKSNSSLQGLPPYLDSQLRQSSSTRPGSSYGGSGSYF